MNQTQHTPNWAIETLVAEEVYTDRQEREDSFVFFVEDAERP
jgi:hypothetical protein